MTMYIKNLIFRCLHFLCSPSIQRPLAKIQNQYSWVTSYLEVEVQSTVQLLTKCNILYKGKCPLPHQYHAYHSGIFQKNRAIRLNFHEQLDNYLKGTHCCKFLKLHICQFLAHCAQQLSLSLPNLHFAVIRPKMIPPQLLAPYLLS